MLILTLLSFLTASTAFAVADMPPQPGYFLLVGGNEQQMEACPSPVMMKKDSLITGAFLQPLYPNQKVEAAKTNNNVHHYVVGAKTIEIKIVTPTELHWNEKSSSKEFKGKLCRRAIYTPNSTSQEEVDTMIEEEDKADPITAAPAEQGKAPAKKAKWKAPAKKAAEKAPEKTTEKKIE